MFGVVDARSFGQKRACDFVCTIHLLSVRGRVIAVEG